MHALLQLGQDTASWGDPLSVLVLYKKNLYIKPLNASAYVGVFAVL